MPKKYFIVNNRNKSTTKKNIKVLTGGKKIKKSSKYGSGSVSLIKRVINNQLETKITTWDWALTPLCLQSTTGTLSNNYIVCNPSNASVNGYNAPARGTGSGQMIGDRIEVKSAVMRFSFVINPYNATTNPQPKPMLIRMYFFRYKKSPQNDLTTAKICGSGVNADVFELGSSDIGFIGDIEDLNQIMNKDSYTFLAQRTFKLGNSIPASGASPGAPVYSYSNNEFKYSILGKMSLTKFFPKKCNRDDSGVWQDNYLFCLIQVVNAEGSIMSNVYAPITWRAHIDIKYKDA